MVAIFFISITIKYRMAQNFGSRKLWQIAANKHFGGRNIGGMAALCSKLARIKFLVDKTLVVFHNVKRARTVDIGGCNIK